MATRLARFPSSASSAGPSASAGAGAGSMWPRTLSGFNALLSGGYSPAPASLRSARCHIDCDVLVPSVRLGLGSHSHSHSRAAALHPAGHAGGHAGPPVRYAPPQTDVAVTPQSGLAQAQAQAQVLALEGRVLDLRHAAQLLRGHSFARDPRLRALLRRHGAAHTADAEDHVVLQLPTSPPRLVVVSDPELLRLLRGNGHPPRSARLALPPPPGRECLPQWTA